MGFFEFLDSLCPSTFILVGLVIIVFFFLVVSVNWSSKLTPYGDTQCMYGYGLKNGPICWRNAFPNAKETLPDLKFSSEYYQPPKEMRANNDGHCVTIFARWEGDARPSVIGGPLEDCYNFYYVKFRWGPNDDEGSEHTIDQKRYAMEVQATHIKAGQKYRDTKAAAEAHAVLNISYLYEISPIDNPYLEPFVSTLKFIRFPFDSCTPEPVPLSWIVPPFTSKYYTYCGSLSHPPCTEGVKWMIQTEPLGISARQLSKFRRLRSVDGPLDMNTRPVQEVRDSVNVKSGGMLDSLARLWLRVRYSINRTPLPPLWMRRVLDTNRDKVFVNGHRRIGRYLPTH